MPRPDACDGDICPECAPYGCSFVDPDTAEEEREEAQISVMAKVIGEKVDAEVQEFMRQNSLKQEMEIPKLPNRSGG